MPPVVLAWALLFVIAFAVVYRFFAWLGRRFSRKPAAPVSTQDHAAIVAPPEESPIPVATEPVSAPAAAPPKPEPAIDRIPGPAPSAASVLDPAPTLPSPLPTADQVVLPRHVPSPAPARDFAVTQVQSAALAAEEPADGPRKPLASSAVISARIAGAAVRTALAPSVAATLPRPKPSVVATLPPKPIDSSPSPASETVDEAISPAVQTATTVAAPSPIIESDFPEPAATDESPTTQSAQARRSARLLARRIGAETARLDIRLRDTRERKIRRAAKSLRKPAERRQAEGMRVLIPKDATRKISLRLRTPSAGKARMKIIGTSPRALRVLGEAGARD